MLRQFAAAAFKVSGGDVVEQQCALLEVAAGQRGFNKGLLAAQPVDPDDSTSLAATLPRPSISPSEWLAVAESSIRAVASLAAGSSRRATTGPAPDRPTGQARGLKAHGVAARGAAAQYRAQCGAQCRARRARGRAAARGRFPPLRWRAAVWRRATRRAVAQCAGRASATSWRGSGFWSCRLRGNSPAAGWPAGSLGLGQRPHTCTDRITIARDVNLNRRVYMTSQTRMSGLFRGLIQKMVKVGLVAEAVAVEHPRFTYVACASSQRAATGVGPPRPASNQVATVSYFFPPLPGRCPGGSFCAGCRVPRPLRAGLSAKHFAPQPSPQGRK